MVDKIYLVFTLDKDNNERFIKAFTGRAIAEKYLQSLNTRGYVQETEVEGG